MITYKSISLWSNEDGCTDVNFCTIIRKDTEVINHTSRNYSDISQSSLERLSGLVYDLSGEHRLTPNQVCPGWSISWHESKSEGE